MTNEEARIYFTDCNERIISIAKDENRYNYETQQIEDVFMRRDFEARELAIKALKQQPKKGKWIRVDDTKLRCSECDVIHFIAMYPSGNVNFCPNCGADMGGDIDE